MYPYLIWLHILGAAVWIGGGVANVVMDRTFTTESASARAALQRAGVALGTRLFMPASVLVLVTGILMVVQSAVWEFENLFVVIGFAMVVIGAVLGSAVYGPTGRRTAAALDAGDTATATAGARRLATIGSLELVLLAITLAGMVWKWGV